MSPDLNTVIDAAMQLPPDQKAELIERLNRSCRPSSRKKEPGKLRKYFGMIDSGDSDSANNEKIDSDLARAYSDNHEPEN